MVSFRSHLEPGFEAYRLGAGALVLATVVILGALAFEHIVGLVPCPLCLQQRYAYYVGIPLIFGALILVSAGRREPSIPIFFLVSLMFLANTALGIYHAGAEWGYWPGPDTCAAAQNLATSADDLMSNLDGTRVVRCDEAAWRFLGLSLAGWNVVASAILFVMTLGAAFAAHDPWMKKSV